MVLSNRSEPVLEAPSLRQFFHESLAESFRRQNLDPSPEASYYLVNLLCQYARAEQLFEWTPDGYTLRPLALLYGDAVEAPTTRHRNVALQRLGDVALFVSGFLSGSLKRLAVDVDYYVNMGGGAYGWLSNNLERDQARQHASETFRELAEGFARFVDAIDDLSEETGFADDRDLIGWYEKWQRTGNPRAARKLARHGIAVSWSGRSDTRH